MALTYGFYDSVLGDRTYNALQMSSIFDGIIEDGVFATYGNAFAVAPGTGMQVSVGIGRAWFKHTWTYNDSALLLNLAAAHALQSRIDIVALEVNKETGVRANSIKIIQGSNASSPVPPALTNTATINQYALAHIFIGPAVTSIIPANITNKIGTTDTPFVTGPLTVVDASIFMDQWESEFIIWFDEMKDQLSSDAAGNLQLQINNHDHSGGDGQPITYGGLATNAVGTLNIIDLSVTGAKLASNSVDDTKAGDRVPQFYRRKGGNSTIWKTPGTTNYTPAAVRMQAGSITLVDLLTTITFPVTFSQPPLVFISPVELGSDVGWVSIQYRSENILSGSFQIRLSGIPAVGQAGNEFHWLAIGPE